MIGAGVVGLSVAHDLAFRGARVRVVDGRGPGQGATRASAGILAPRIEAHTGPLLMLGVSSLDQYDDFIARVRADARHPIEYRREGTLQVACDDREVQRLEEAHRGLAAAGVPHALMDGNEARRLERSLAPSVCAALHVPGHGHVGVAGLMTALEQAAAARGAELTLGRARAIEAPGGRPTLVTDAGALAADAIVIAAGAWSRDLVVGDGPPPPVRPIRGQLLHLRLPAPPASRVIWGPDCYLVPWCDGSVLVGATVEDVGFDERATAAGVQQLLAGGTALMPGLAAAVFDEVRVGLRPATADELPVVGASATMPGVFYATGHYRNGVLLAPLTAALVSDLVLEGRSRPELELVTPARVGL